ncbi:hypothetical protein E2562_024354 [Oryza meyeriana var. granulata]|uniref:Uncharacterized protein n=1 Tax=Oryza meyeriana var. granulata TaxID=110450 RepID=A0A6G1C750_9ORYZ|nr:hypothetical protein E2562_024354 [Oryza meyeriana var. granulata]
MSQHTAGVALAAASVAWLAASRADLLIKAVAMVVSCALRFGPSASRFPPLQSATQASPETLILNPYLFLPTATSSHLLSLAPPLPSPVHDTLSSLLASPYPAPSAEIACGVLAAFWPWGW